MRAIDHPDELHARFSISQDGVYAVDEEGGLWRLDTAPPSCVYESPRRASHGCIDAKVDVDAGVFVSMRTGLEGNAVEVVALSDLRERRVFGLEPGGRGRIDVGDNALVVVSGTVLHAWRLDDGSRLCEVEVGGGIAALAVSRDAHWIACGKYGSDVLLFKLPEGKLAQGYRQLYPERDAASLHFSPDAKWVYAGFWYAAAGYAPSPRVLVLEVPPQ